MTLLALIFWIIAVVLFVLDWADSRRSTRGGYGYLTALGLASLTLGLIFEHLGVGPAVSS